MTVVNPLSNVLTVCVDNDVATGWPGGLAKLGRVKIDDYALIMNALFDARIASAALLDEWRSLPGLTRQAGIRYDPKWDGAPETPPEACAAMASAHISALEQDGVRRVAVAELDVENHNVVWQEKFLLGFTTPGGVRVKGWRGRGGSLPDASLVDTLGWRWGRPFVYTFEGRQAGNTAAAVIAARAGGLIAPQLYNGAMTEEWPWHEELRTWCRPGQGAQVIPFNRMIPYIDADRRHRDVGHREAILFATSRLTELYE
jgi:hypothetical protein